MVYTIWDIESNNLVAEYKSEREALSLVWRGIEQNGLHDADLLALEMEDDHGEVTTIASGQALAELAQREFGTVPQAR